ncbi:MAG: DALR anticodon-binding domain-containing protein [Pseudanabaena sp.]|jgi:arginyl-tRNA synthetase
MIGKSVNIQNAIATAINAEYKLVLDPREITLEICYPKYAVHYSSAIALAISNRLGIEAFQIAEKIRENCSQPEILAQWQIKSSVKGLLNIRLSDKHLDDSLHTLMSWQLAEEFFEISSEPTLWQKREIYRNHPQQSPEPMQQYAHARCCVLIRLMEENSRYTETIIKIEPIEPEEVSLLLRNLAIADYLENENILPTTRQINNRQKLSRSLAEAFLQFYDRCRVFGVDRYAVQRRFLLIRVTQKFLVAIAPPEVNYAIYL